MAESCPQVSRPRAGALFALVVLAAMSARAEGPTLEALPGAWRVSNAHYAAVISRSGGGLLAELTDARGRRLLDRFEIYTDVGLYDGRVSYSSRNEPSAALSWTKPGREITLVTRGRLLRQAEGEPDYPLVRYEVKLTFDATAAIRVAITLEPEFTVKPQRAFLALIIGLPDAPEFFANTADGLLCQDAATRSARTWQSANDLLHPRRPFFGVCTQRKTCIAFTDIRSESGLANVFVHESGKRTLAAFFAWRDGPSPSAIAKGQKLDLAYTLRLLREPDKLRGLLRE